MTLMMAMTATPPTEPPTIMPMGAGDDELVGVGGIMDMV